MGARRSRWHTLTWHNTLLAPFHTLAHSSVWCCCHRDPPPFERHTNTQGLTYDHAQATINGTVCLKLPRWLEVLLHHANHHLPAHVSISIPSYNAPAAQVRVLLCDCRVLRRVGC